MNSKQFYRYKGKIMLDSSCSVKDITPVSANEDEAKCCFVVVSEDKDRQIALMAENFTKKQLWLQAFDQALNCGLQTRVFGVALEHIMARNHETKPYPSVVERLINHIIENSLSVEGLFRISGSARMIQTFKEAIDSGVPVNFSECKDNHTMASLLKIFFREMPHPVIPEEFYDSFLSVYDEGNTINETDTDSQSGDTLSSLELLRQLVDQLPPCNYNLLAFLMRFLALVGSYSDQNKMTVNNLALVFAPNLFWQTSPDQTELNAVRKTTKYQQEVFSQADKLKAVVETMVNNHNFVFSWKGIGEGIRLGFENEIDESFGFHYKPIRKFHPPSTSTTVFYKLLLDEEKLQQEKKKTTSRPLAKKTVSGNIVLYSSNESVDKKKKKSPKRKKSNEEQHIPTLGSPGSTSPTGSLIATNSGLRTNKFRYTIVAPHPLQLKLIQLQKREQWKQEGHDEVEKGENPLESIANECDEEIRSLDKKIAKYGEISPLREAIEEHSASSQGSYLSLGEEVQLEQKEGLQDSQQLQQLPDGQINTQQTQEIPKIQETQPSPKNKQQTEQIEQTKQTKHTEATKLTEQNQPTQSTLLLPERPKPPPKPQPSPPKKLGMSNSKLPKPGFSKQESPTDSPSPAQQQIVSPRRCRQISEPFYGGSRTAPQAPEHLFPLPERPFSERKPLSICTTCDRDIKGKGVVVLGRAYHFECFVCFHCHLPFKEGETFMEKNACFYCPSDYQSLFGTCASCHKVIQEDQQLVEALQKVWHLECFVCHSCREPFANGRFVPKEGLPFCKACLSNQSEQKN